MFSSNSSQVSNDANYIESCFSTYLYSGNGTSQTINNGIDLAGEGGLVWLKSRSTADNHFLFDTTRGATKLLQSNTTGAEITNANTLTSFASTGFSLGTETAVNRSGTTFASWTFRKQPKFFDVVTWTGNGTTQNIAHNLGAVPGCIIVKRTDSSGSWAIYHRGLTYPQATAQQNGLNFTTGAGLTVGYWNNTAPTSTVFTVGTSNFVNASGGTYVAYLFAHDAGGFGLTGTDNVISCGSFTTDGSGLATVDLGYEPQYVLVKRTSASSDWFIFDTMRGLTVNNDNWLTANTADAESSGLNLINPTSTGFTINFSVLGYTSASFIYIAIRRGPMKVPESGASVFSPNAVSTTTGTQITTGFPPDLQIFSLRTGTTNKNNVYDRLRGVSSNTTESGVRLITSSTAAETIAGNETLYWNNTGFQMTSVFSGTSDIFWNFGRAPGFMDVVCYTGTGVARTVAHNLGVAPELMIVKSRSAVSNWRTYNATDGNTKYMNLQDIDASVVDSTNWNNTSPTSSVFTVGTNSNVNASGGNFVAYLFASCPGVSKVGSYTGTGTTQQINCGFTAGARFVLIKRTDSTGAWYVWDSARGIVAGNDPYLLLNSTAAEVTSTDYVDTYSAGFEISSTAPAAINASGGSFIFLAIA